MQAGIRRQESGAPPERGRSHAAESDKPPSPRQKSTNPVSGGVSRRRRGKARNPESCVYQPTVVGLEVRSPTSGVMGSDASGESENVRNLIA